MVLLLLLLLLLLLVNEFVRSERGRVEAPVSSVETEMLGVGSVRDIALVLSVPRGTNNRSRFYYFTLAAFSFLSLPFPPLFSCPRFSNSDSETADRRLRRSSALEEAHSIQAASTMGPDEDLPTLIKGKDHLNVLRYLRIHQLREPEIAVEHGTALLGPDLSRKISDEMARLAVLEQLLLAAADVHNMALAEQCLSKLRDAGVEKDSTRFRRLLARCLEADGDIAEAALIYDDLLAENPANLLALKRKYCILRAQVGKETEAMEALNKSLEQNYSDPAAWYEMANLRAEMGDYKGAAFCLEELLLSVPADAKIHVELAEAYSTVGGLENYLLARKHMAQALELDPANRRAQMGLVTTANAYLEATEAASKKVVFDQHEVEVAKELVKYGSEQVLASYKGSPMFAAVQTLMSEYTEAL